MQPFLKRATPHYEAEHEAEGLRFWNGDPTIRLLGHDQQAGTLLLERCDPGTPLSTFPEPEQDQILAPLIKRLWRRPQDPHPFRHLSEMLARWATEVSEDTPLTREGIRLFRELAKPKPTDVLLHTDLHAGNVLSAQREPWLVIDPKPFIGPHAYDATQHLLNCQARLLANPTGTIESFSTRLNVDPAEVRLWLFARAAAGPPGDWDLTSIAKALGPV